MEIELPCSDIVLAPRRLLKLRRARGQIIACTAGKLWITTAGRSADVFLGAGESHTIDSHELVLIEAIEAGCLRLLPASRFCRWRPGACPGTGA